VTVWFQNIRSYKVELTLGILVMVAHLALTRWDAIVHGGDQVSLRMLAQSVFSETPFRQDVIYYFVDWRPFGYPDDHNPPLPTIIWALLIRATGGWENSILALNAVVWSVQVFLWSDLSRIAFGSRLPGLLTFVAFSFSFSVPYDVTTGLKEPLAILFLLLFLRVFLGGDTPGRSAWAGVLLGASYLCRYNVLILAPLAGIFAAVWPARGRRSAGVLNGASLVLAFTAVISPWLIRNQLLLGDPFAQITVDYLFAFGGYFSDAYQQFWEFPPTTGNLRGGAFSRANAACGIPGARQASRS
jgi:hypothetical protein